MDTGAAVAPGRADVAASQLRDGSWKDIRPVGSDPAVALGISVSWHKAHPALQAGQFHATGIHTGHTEHSRGWVGKGRREPGSATGAVNGAGLGEGTGFVNLQQEPGWGGGVGVGNMAVLTETTSLFGWLPMPAPASPIAVGNRSPDTVTCCLADRKPDWHLY